MSDDRAERLRQRRRRSKPVSEEQSDSADEQSNASESSGLSEPDKPSEQSGSQGRGGDSQSVKEEHVGVYMYLPEGQRDEVRYQYKRLDAEFQREFGQELEKNRQFYPLLIQYGLDRLSGWDATDVADRLEGLDVQ